MNEPIYTHGHNDCIDTAIAALGAKPFSIKAGYIFSRNGGIYWALYRALRGLGDELLKGADPESAIEGWISDTAHWMGPHHAWLTRLDGPVH